MFNQWLLDPEVLCWNHPPHPQPYCSPVSMALKKFPNLVKTGKSVLWRVRTQSCSFYLPCSNGTLLVIISKPSPSLMDSTSYVSSSTCIWIKFQIVHMTYIKDGLAGFGPVRSPTPNPLVTCLLVHCWLSSAQDRAWPPQGIQWGSVEGRKAGKQRGKLLPASFKVTEMT